MGPISSWAIPNNPRRPCVLCRPATCWVSTGGATGDWEVRCMRCIGWWGHGGFGADGMKTVRFQILGQLSDGFRYTFRYTFSLSDCMWFWYWFFLVLCHHGSTVHHVPPTVFSLKPGFLWFLCSLDVPAILFSGVFWRIFFSGVWASPQGRNKSWLSSSEPMPVPAPRMSSVVIQVSSEFGIPQLPFGRETDDQRWGISDIQVDMSTIWINRGLKCCTPNFGTQGTCVMWQGRRSESHAPRARACLGDWVRGFLKDGRSVRSVKRAE